MTENPETTIKEIKKRGPKPKPNTPERIEELKQHTREYIKNYYHQHKDTFNLSRYKHAKIYKMTSPHTTKFYIGCTVMPNLNKRYQVHLNKMKNSHNKTYVIMNGISNDWKIELIHECNLKGREELEQLESIWITAFKDEALNYNKKYTDEIIKPYLDGRFDDSCLPEKYRGLSQKKV
jgi:hypothetical protein